jgi:hypothetical protein
LATLARGVDDLEHDGRIGIGRARERPDRSEERGRHHALELADLLRFEGREALHGLADAAAPGGVRGLGRDEAALTGYREDLVAAAAIVGARSIIPRDAELLPRRGVCGARPP